EAGLARRDPPGAGTGRAPSGAAAALLHACPARAEAPARAAWQASVDPRSVAARADRAHVARAVPGRVPVRAARGGSLPSCRGADLREVEGLPEARAADAERGRGAARLQPRSDWARPPGRPVGPRQPNRP